MPLRSTLVDGRAFANQRVEAGNDRNRREAVAAGRVGKGRLSQEQRSLGLGSGAVASCPEAASPELLAFARPLALVTEEVRNGTLLMPIERPAVSSRGYFIYAPAASNHAPAIVALRKWLTDAGRATEAALPEHLG
jgi:DNA-binding transcriptional LysR family regulator